MNLQEAYKGMMRNLRLLAFSWCIRLGLQILPKDAIKTALWITQIPLEEL